LNTDLILVLNAGSSSLKFALYPREGGHDSQGTAAIASGIIDGLEPGGTPRLQLQRTGAAASAARLLPDGPGDSFDRALLALRGSLAEMAGTRRLAAIAHRIVHGGDRYSASILIDNAALAYLRKLEPLAPLHQPHNLAGVRACVRAWPGLPQVGCFDTGFHATLPAVERRFALPHALDDAGIRRYGFHGLSYRYLAGRLRTLSRRSNGRMLLAHLGNGASVCATLEGRSAATSMGFSTLDGLMMGTRSGALDPGVLLHLLQQGWDLPRMEQLLYRESGLLGVSGISADMRVLRASDQASAREAIALFEQRLVRECGALAACIGGVDVLAFTGGIGEHDAALRLAACQRLRHLGIEIDPAANLLAHGDAALPIHAAGSAVEIWVIPTDEGRVAASDAAALLAHAPPPSES
jgi:acetate kinase